MKNRVVLYSIIPTVEIILFALFFSVYKIGIWLILVLWFIVFTLCEVLYKKRLVFKIYKILYLSGALGSIPYTVFTWHMYTEGADEAAIAVMIVVYIIFIFTPNCLLGVFYNHRHSIDCIYEEHERVR